MKTKNPLLKLFSIGVLTSIGLVSNALSVPFSYQGQLSADGQPANGSYDLRLSLFGSPNGGAATAAPVILEDVVVESGIFSTLLDFGDGVFDGSAAYIQVEVRDGTSTSAYTTLSPRQMIGAAPYAQFAIEGGCFP
jgi:hypothetical protein